MYKIGTDIVLVSRIEKSIKNERFKKDVFTQSELNHCKRAENFAGIFAAKEAYLKALGTGINRKLNSIEILYTDKGKPYINNQENCDVSISHDGEYAISTVIIYENING